MYFRLWKLQIWAIFLFKFKMGHKAVEITHNTNDAFGPGTANEHTVQWRFKKFCKGDERLEDEELSGQPLEINNNQLRAIIEADLLIITQEVAQELSVNHSLVIWYLKQIGKKEKLSKWVPHELTCALSPTLRPHGLQPVRPSVHGILQVWILEWVAMSFSRVSSWPRDWTCIT